MNSTRIKIVNQTNDHKLTLPVEIGKGSLLLLGFLQGERSLSRRKKTS